MRLTLKRNFESLLAGIQTGQQVSLDDRLLYRYQAALVVERCCQHAYKLHSACGGRGIFLDFPLVRPFMDVLTARAHYANNPDIFGRNFGAVSLGKENTDFFV
jgi:3-hydroxy-9,10-secoandrosta-1,3,5(10)-triene-9,17-dione monooxygenase